MERSQSFWKVLEGKGRDLSHRSSSLAAFCSAVDHGKISQPGIMGPLTSATGMRKFSLFPRK